MRLIDAYAELLAMRQPVFTTSEMAGHWRLPGVAASRMLTRLAEAGHLLKLRRGLWCIAGEVNALQAAHSLVAPFPAYVSLQSALFHHAIISQVPAVVYVVSPARTRRLVTPLGDYSIHHVQPGFFFGYAVLEDGMTRMASREKALVDFLYLHCARSALFRSLPEVELPGSFSVNKARGMIKRIAAPKRRAMVDGLFEALIDMCR